MWKDFFYFTKKEKQGILVLFVIIAGICIGRHLFSTADTQKKEVVEVFHQEGNDSVKEKSPRKNNGYYTQTSPKKRYFYEKKEEGKEETRTYYNNKNKDIDSTLKFFSKAEKYSSGTVIEINSADTLELMKIPGVGRSFAARITKYRQLLGGYYSVEQLKEVYGMYEELYGKINPFFKINPDSIRLISVNRCSLEQLKAHPYIDFYQAKIIVELRKKKGKLMNMDELKLFEEFQETDIGKMKNYLSFD